MHVKHTIP